MNNGILYHYTDLKGFLGIIKHRKLRLTSAFNLNDSQEVIWARRKIEKKLDALATKYGEDLPKLIKQANQFSSVVPYVCSLTSEEDLLSQWRGYSQDGTGVAVGIKRSVLPEVEVTSKVPSTTELVLAEVVYKEDEQDRQINDILESIFKEDLPPEGKIKALTRGLFALSRIMPTFKNGSFSQEKEWRIIYAHDPYAIDLMKHLTIQHSTIPSISSPKFRISGSKIATYFEYYLGPTASDIFAKVILGPKCNTSYRDMSLLLAHYELENLPFRPSISSYK